MKERQTAWREIAIPDKISEYLTFKQKQDASIHSNLKYVAKHKTYKLGWAGAQSRPRQLDSKYKFCQMDISLKLSSSYEFM